MYTVHKTELPASELGSGRCFQIKYYGHGDILAATWNGPLDLEPSADDGVSIRFGFTHGSDAVILASLAGYLKRCDRSDEEVCSTIQKAGGEILSDDSKSLADYRSLQQNYVNRVADGAPLTGFDYHQQGLSCLALPMPTQPGRIEAGGGTGIYTKSTEGSDYLVFAGLAPSTDLEGHKVMEIDRTAGFCERDIPSMAHMVCDMALGEYRKDIHAFLANLYAEELL